MVLADLLPNVNELFQWKGFFGQHTFYEFNKTALMAFVSTAMCIILFAIGSRKKCSPPSATSTRGWPANCPSVAETSGSAASDFAT